MMPFETASLMISKAIAGSGSLVFLSFTNSTRRMAPIPLTSPTHGYFISQGAIRASIFSPKRVESDKNAGDDKILTASMAATAATGLPP